MKYTAIFLAIILAVAGSAFAQTVPPDTSMTAAAQGSYPAGTAFNGIPLTGFTIGNGAIIYGDGTGAEGHVGISLLGPTLPVGGQQVINIDAVISGGSSTAANLATVNGTATVDLGNGTAPLTGVPIVITISANPDDGSGTVGIVLGATTLPTSAISDGTMTVAPMQ